MPDNERPHEEQPQLESVGYDWAVNTETEQHWATGETPQAVEQRAQDYKVALPPQLESLLPEIKRLVDESNDRIGACRGFNAGSGEFRRLTEESRTAWRNHMGPDVDEVQFNREFDLLLDALDERYPE